MKHIFLIIISLLFTGFIKSQVGINTETPKATLHIEAKNSITPESSVGLGIPVLQQFPISNPNTLQNGMLIYNKTANNTRLEGFYYWDAAESNWEYMVDFKGNNLDLSKTIAIGNALFPNNISGGGIQARTIPLTTLNTVDSGFSLTSSGGLKIGKTGNYYLVFTGGVFKTASNVVNEYTTNIYINNVSNNQLTATNSAPGGSTAGRSATFYISTILSLLENDVLTISTSRNTTSANTVSVDTPYTLSLIQID